MKVLGKKDRSHIKTTVRAHFSTTIKWEQNIVE